MNIYDQVFPTENVDTTTIDLSSGTKYEFDNLKQTKNIKVQLIFQLAYFKLSKQYLPLLICLVMIYFLSAYTELKLGTECSYSTSCPRKKFVEEILLQLVETLLFYILTMVLLVF